MIAFEVLPKLAHEVKSDTIAALLEVHLTETEEHAARVERAFGAVGVEPSSNRDGGLDALWRQHDEQAADAVGDRLADLVHVGAAIRIEHAELALYEILVRLADATGVDDVGGLLAPNREDELRTLELLEREAARLAGVLVG